MRNFKDWLFEEKDSTFEGREPHHQYHTEDGHLIHVHLDKNEKGTHATFINHSIGSKKTKLVHWNVGATPPSKHELEMLGKEEESLNEENSFASYLIEKRANVDKLVTPKAKKEVKPKKEAKHVNDDGSLSINAGGKVTELATVVHLIGHKHKDLGTFGSKEHDAEVKPFKDEIASMTKGANKDAVQLRLEHGRAAANAIRQNVKDEHGEKAKIINVGHTAKPGDISRFTRGVHNDGQENTSDVAMEISGSKKKPHKDNSDGTVFEGASLKSSKAGGEVTGKNTGPNIEGMLDTPERKLNADEVGRKAMKKHVHDTMGVGHLIAARRGEMLEKHREEHLAAGGKKNESAWELEANEKNRHAIKAQTGELHDHLNHLMDNGKHHMIGHMLKKHLMPDVSMPTTKVKAVGKTTDKVRAVVEPNSEHPMKDVFNNKKTEYYAKKTAEGAALQVGYKHPETGEHVPIAYYSPKPKSSAYKSDNMGWNVRPVKFH